jgi:DNA-directed RNA polymerase specialized sigma24 family protein
LSSGLSSLNRDPQAELLALAGELRPDLHRYCARLMGSVIDGEDVVQDRLVRAFVALQDLEEVPPLRPWLFRIAHNRALDLLRSREVRMAEPIDAAADVADSARPDPLETLMRKEAVKTAAPWIPERSATRLREADLDVLSKLGKQGLEWRLEPEAFAGGEVGCEDDLLDVLVGYAVDIEMARQPST